MDSTTDEAPQGEVIDTRAPQTLGLYCDRCGTTFNALTEGEGDNEQAALDDQDGKPRTCPRCKSGDMRFQLRRYRNMERPTRMTCHVDTGEKDDEDKPIECGYRGWSDGYRNEMALHKAQAHPRNSET